MTERQRIRKQERGKKHQQAEEQSLPVTDRSQEEQRQTRDRDDAVFAALVTEVPGAHQPHQVISNERLWRENVQQEGE